MKSPQQVKDSRDKQNILIATKEDLEQNTSDIPDRDAKTGACDSEGTENSGCPIASVQ